MEGTDIGAGSDVLGFLRLVVVEAMDVLDTVSRVDEEAVDTLDIIVLSDDELRDGLISNRDMGDETAEDAMVDEVADCFDVKLVVTVAVDVVVSVLGAPIIDVSLTPLPCLL